MSQLSRVKARIHGILEPASSGDRLSRAIDRTMVLLILGSVVSSIASTVPSIAARRADWLLPLEFFWVTLFTVELLLRLWLAEFSVEPGVRSPRLEYLRSRQGIADVLAILPFYLAFLLPIESSTIYALGGLRILKLVRYSRAMATLASVVARERKTLLAALEMMITVLLISSTVLYLTERHAQPDAFESIPKAMWWGIVTLTTVGYGDVVPLTSLGRFFGAIVNVLGIVMFALPTGILATGFARELKQRDFMVTWNLVSRVPLFTGLDAADIARISRLLQPLVLQADTVVVRQGEPADSMFIVLSGRLSVDLEEDQARLAVGDFFGEIGLLRGGERSATVRCMTRCQLLVLEKESYESLAQSAPHIAARVSKVARERLAADAGRREGAKDERVTDDSS